MLKGTTGSGFSFAVEETKLDNMELLDALSEMGDGDEAAALALPRVCLLILGKEQRRRLYDHLRREDGTVPIAQVEAAIADIMNASAAGKNSSSSPE